MRSLCRRTASSQSVYLPEMCHQESSRYTDRAACPDLRGEPAAKNPGQGLTSLFETCTQISDSLARTAGDKLPTRIELRRDKRHAVVCSQGRIPSLTPSQ